MKRVGNKISRDIRNILRNVAYPKLGMDLWTPLWLEIQSPIHSRLYFFREIQPQFKEFFLTRRKKK